MSRWALALAAATWLGSGCTPADTGDSVDSTDPVETDTDPADTSRWSGTATVRVVDPDGAPLEGMNVMVGGAPPEDWVQTDAAGMATLDVPDDGVTLRAILAGQEGWITGTGRFSQTDGPDGVLDIVMQPLPDEDGVGYAFQPGGDRHSPDTSECGHCHWTIGSDWAGSQHREAARNPKLWDTYLGGSTAVGADAGACADLGGWLAVGQLPGELGATTDRCYLGDGVLPWLHDGCGGPDEPACDHPDQRGALQRFGSCGDCHAPAVTGGQPGRIDLAGLEGLPYAEGVACDFCHKVREVIPGPEPGIDGGIVLHRPSLPTTMPGQQYEPINYGPYPDVGIRIMNGSWVPQFREASWCAGCHEYAQPALHPDERVDASRWPDGVPVQETWSEYLRSGLGETPVTCQTCHMPVLDEESSTYDITPRGVAPSLDQGWFRASGEVRHHDFARVPESPPALSLRVSDAAGQIEAAVEVRNDLAGHAIPTGEPLRQLIVLVTAQDDDGPVAAVGGQTAPDVAGFSARGVLGDDATLAGTELRLAGADLPDDLVAARFVRPTGAWDDYEGTDIGWFSHEDRTAEEKGLELHDFVAEVAVTATSGDAVTLAAAPTVLPGDLVYLVAADEWAGHPGWVYAKVLVAADGERGVPHFRAVDVASDNRIRKGGKATSTHRFQASGLPVQVTARLVYRRYAAGPAATYGWDLADEELKTATRVH